MARLQDFQNVTPTDSDKLLVVQSQGQGLATFGSTLGAKMNKTNPTGNGSLSLNRKSGTTVGYMSTTEGTDGTATGNYSHAGGYQGVATSFASYAEGQSCEASGYTAHAQGLGTKANHRSQFVFGEYNVADASTADATAKGNYIEVVGKGTSDANRSNARTLDWSGNEVLAGGLKINGNQDVKALKEDSVTVSMSSTAGQYVTSLNWSTYHIVNAWITGEKYLIISRPSNLGKVVFNIYDDFVAITNSSVTVHFMYF